MTYPTTYKDRLGTWPVYRTVVFKFFATSLVTRAEALLACLERVWDLPGIGGLQTFERLGYFPLSGPRKTRRVSRSTPQDLNNLVRAGSARSFELARETDEALFADTRVMAYLPREKDEFSQVAIWSRLDDFNPGYPYFTFFCNTCLALQTHYAFASVHIDSKDSEAMRGYFAAAIASVPLDCINSSRYECDSTSRIKDVCWLNFLSSDHLSVLDRSTINELTTQPLYQQLSTGLCFGIASRPTLEDLQPGRLQRLRSLLQPLIYLDDWYRDR